MTWYPFNHQHIHDITFFPCIVIIIVDITPPYEMKQFSSLSVNMPCYIETIDGTQGVFVNMTNIRYSFKWLEEDEKKKLIIIILLVHAATECVHFDRRTWARIVEHPNTHSTAQNEADDGWNDVHVRIKCLWCGYSLVWHWYIILNSYGTCIFMFIRRDNNNMIISPHIGYWPKEVTVLFVLPRDFWVWPMPMLVDRRWHMCDVSLLLQPVRAVAQNTQRKRNKQTKQEEWHAGRDEWLRVYAYIIHFSTHPTLHMALQRERNGSSNIRNSNIARLFVHKTPATLDKESD